MRHKFGFHYVEFELLVPCQCEQKVYRINTYLYTNASALTHTQTHTDTHTQDKYILIHQFLRPHTHAHTRKKCPVYSLNVRLVLNNVILYNADIFRLEYNQPAKWSIPADPKWYETLRGSLWLPLIRWVKSAPQVSWFITKILHRTVGIQNEAIYHNKRAWELIWPSSHCTKIPAMHIKSVKQCLLYHAPFK